MVDRDQVTLAAGAGLLLSLTVLYGFFEPAFASGIEYLDHAFLVAGLCWIVGYVNCRGFEWGDSTPVNGLYVASWGLLLGMEFTQYVPDLIASYEPYGAAIAITIHMAAYGATVIESR